MRRHMGAKRPKQRVPAGPGFAVFGTGVTLVSSLFPYRNAALLDIKAEEVPRRGILR